MWQDFYLKFSNRAACLAGLEDDWQTLQGGDVRVHQSPHGTALIDVVGVLYQPAELDPVSGEVITPAMAKPGWHINLRLLQGTLEGACATLPPLWLDAVIQPPQQPQRVFAA